MGYEEGRNVAFETRWAEGKFERLPELAAELVRAKVDVIVANGTPGNLAAKRATATIPIVMVAVSDPVSSGLVNSLARPGGNVTGLSDIQSEISAKHLEMLFSMVPKLPRVAVLVNPDNPSYPTILKNLQAAAQKTGVTILPVEARTSQQIEQQFALMVKERAGALIVASDGLFVQQRHQIADLAATHRLPCISTLSLYAEAGFLMSYGANLADDFRRSAVLVDKILKGTKPGDLPVEQSMKFDMVINSKTAKTLGIKIPNSILVQATKVIE